MPLKFLNLLVVASLLAVTIACDKDEDDPCTDLGDTLVGSWSVTALGQDVGDVEFKSDGTLIDPDGVLVEGEVGGVILDEKSYEVHADTSFTAIASKGSNSLSFDYDVISFSCDQVTMDVLGIVATMSRN